MTQASPFFNSSLNEVLLRCLCVGTCTCGTFLLPGLAAQEQRIHLVNARIASNFHHHKEYRSSCSQRPDFFRVADENSNYWSKALFYFLFFFFGFNRYFQSVLQSKQSHSFSRSLRPFGLCRVSLDVNLGAEVMG